MLKEGVALKTNGFIYLWLTNCIARQQLRKPITKIGRNKKNFRKLVALRNGVGACTEIFEIVETKVIKKGKSKVGHNFGYMKNRLVKNYVHFLRVVGQDSGRSWFPEERFPKVGP